MVLIAIFILSLVAVILQTVGEARDERSTRSNLGTRATRDDWAQVASAMDLELKPGTDLDDSVLRGSVSGHWISVEQRTSSIEINVNYRSGVGSFRVGEPGSEHPDDGQLFATGDDAFDMELSVLTRSPEEIGEYLSPARRNALLWLKSSFDLDDVDEEDINVRFVNPQWTPDELVSAITLVVDVANILQTGQKVFMAPPVSTKQDHGDDSSDGTVDNSDGTVDNSDGTVSNSDGTVDNSKVAPIRR